MSQLDRIVLRLRALECDVRETANGCRAVCPAHESRNRTRSLSISEGEAGRVLLKCFAGCPFEAIVAALGMDSADLGPFSNGPAPKSSRGRREVGRRSWQIEVQSGQTVEHVRIDFDDGSKTCFWQTNGRGGLQGIPVSDLQLYNVAALRAAKPGSTVIVTEGEPACDALIERDVLAVATVTGASGTPSPEVLRVLLPFAVILWPDNDPGDEKEARSRLGQKHMVRIAEIVEQLGGSPRLLTWGDAPPKGDAVDFFAAGHTVADLPALIDAAVAREVFVSSVIFVRGGGDWEEPLPLVDLRDLPDMPLAAFPKPVRRYCQGLAAAIQVPVATVGALVLSTLSLCICRRFVVSPWPGFVECCSLWTFIVAASGARKTAAGETVLKPVAAFERDLQAAMKDEIARAEAKQRVLKRRLRDAEKEASKDPDDPSLLLAAQALAVELAHFHVPATPRLFTTNVTNEGLASLMADTDGRLLVYSSEGAEIISIAAGLYSGGQDNYDIFLKGWSGDSVVIDRKQSRPVRVDNPSVAMALMVQPAVLDDLAARPSFRGRGLLGRFLYVLARSLVGYRKARGQPLSEDARSGYHQIVRHLLDLPDVRDHAGRLQPRTIHFDSAAAALLESFFDRLEHAQREFGELEGLADWASKGHGQVARIAAVLHMSEHHEQQEPWRLPVSEETAASAIELGEFFLAHAKAAFDCMGADPKVARAQRVLRYLAQKQIGEISRRDLYRQLATHFKDTDELDGTLEFLEERGYVRVDRPAPGPGQRGRPTAGTVIVNPGWVRQKRQKCQNPDAADPEPSFGTSVSFVSGGESTDDAGFAAEERRAIQEADETDPEDGE